MKPEFMSSRSNPLWKDVRKAVSQGSLTAAGWIVAESLHLLEEAVRSGRTVHAVLMSESAAGAMSKKVPKGVRGVSVPDAMFAEVSSTEVSRGLIALVQPRVWSESDVFGARPLVIALDGVQDPGNAGAILRAGEAFGASGALLLRGTVSAWNPKAARASAGSLFRLPLRLGCEPADVLRLAREHHCKVYATLPDKGLRLDQADLTRPCVLVIGNEGKGVSAELQAAAEPLRIPTDGVESLNAAMAATVLLYEASRQRGRSGGR